MNSIEKLAQLFKDRDNPYIINATAGEVISTGPLKIKWGESIILGEKDLVVGSILKTGFSVPYTDDNNAGTITKSITIINPLSIGDKVILLPDTDFKTWYVIDKVG